jgi:hypothetical protein
MLRIMEQETHLTFLVHDDDDDIGLHILILHTLNMSRVPLGYAHRRLNTTGLHRSLADGFVLPHHCRNAVDLHCRIYTSSDLHKRTSLLLSILCIQTALWAAEPLYLHMDLNSQIILSLLKLFSAPCIFSITLVYSNEYTIIADVKSSILSQHFSAHMCHLQGILHQIICNIFYKFMW